jgi:hypothetical protein
MQPDFDAICIGCKHFKINKLEFSYSCDAFPDGIPDEILSGEFIHDKPFAGDNGIQYEKKTIEDIE